MQVRDLSDEEMKNMSMEERKKVARIRLNIKKEVFHPMLLMMSSNKLKSEKDAVHNLGSTEEVNFAVNLMKCQDEVGGKQLTCLMNLDCRSELVYYTRCIIQY